MNTYYNEYYEDYNEDYDYEYEVYLEEKERIENEYKKFQIQVKNKREEKRLNKI